MILRSYPHLQPQRPVSPQHPLDLTEDLDQLLHPLLGGFFEADLLVYAGGSALELHIATSGFGFSIRYYQPISNRPSLQFRLLVRLACCTDVIASIPPSSAEAIVQPVERRRGHAAVDGLGGGGAQLRASPCISVTSGSREVNSSLSLEYATATRSAEALALSLNAVFDG